MYLVRYKAHNYLAVSKLEARRYIMCLITQYRFLNINLDVSKILVEYISGPDADNVALCCFNIK